MRARGKGQRSRSQKETPRPDASPAEASALAVRPPDRRLPLFRPRVVAPCHGGWRDGRGRGGGHAWQGFPPSLLSAASPASGTGLAGHGTLQGSVRRMKVPGPRRKPAHWGPVPPPMAPQATPPPATPPADAKAGLAALGCSHAAQPADLERSSPLRRVSERRGRRGQRAGTPSVFPGKNGPGTSAPPAVEWGGERGVALAFLPLPVPPPRPRRGLELSLSWAWPPHREMEVSLERGGLPGERGVVTLAGGRPAARVFLGPVGRSRDFAVPSVTAALGTLESWLPTTPFRPR